MRRLKILFPACILFIFCITSSKAQDVWTSYSRVIPVKGYEGHRFRLEAFVKTAIEDDSASARLWARVDKDNGYGFFENMWLRPVRSREWKIYTIEGKIDSDATQLAFGALCQYNGKFYYDDFKIQIETAKNKWQTVFSDDFENNLDGWTMGIQKGDDGKNSKFKADLLKGEAAKGNGYLAIEGKDVSNYGINNKVGKYADVNGIKLYYEIYGEGKPLLVMHGNGGSIESASPFYSELSKKYKVIAIDSRAQGKSTDTNAELTYDQMASDVNELLNQLKFDSVFIWGQSDGAILGLLLAMNYPEKVSRVLAFGSNIQPDSLAIFPWAITYVEKKAKTSTDIRERKLNKLMLDYPRIPYSKLWQIKAPVLIMAGDRDVIRPEHTLKLFQNIPNSQLCIIPGATHGASWEKKEFFLKVLDDFFNKPFEMPTTADWFKE